MFVRLLLVSVAALSLAACHREPENHTTPDAAAGTTSGTAATAAGSAAAPAATAIYIAPAPSNKPLSAMAQLGRKLFFDPSLSASGQQSCASCHSPDHAFAPDNSLAVQIGGPHMSLQGQRAVPSLGYLNDTPNFIIGAEPANDADLHPMPSAASAPPVQTSPLATQRSGTTKAALVASAAAPETVPQGGFFWDGRENTLQGQALGPLLNPLEMANVTPEALVKRLQHIGYSEDFKQLFGPRIMQDRQLLLSEAVFAIGRYEFEEPGFHPYNSKYDQYLAGKLALTAQEQRGLKLFEDPKKGNCSSCHLDKPTSDGQPPAFTDYQFEGLGVPRNPEIHSNAKADHYDLGICGPDRKDDYAKQPQNCGLFKTPTLRNVATRHAFFHNGAFHSLDEVLHFYVQRDTNPEKFYPVGADGKVQKFNDVPEKYRGNIDVIDAPFDRHPGDQPALTDAEIKDVIAFLGTLTDGYRP